MQQGTSIEVFRTALSQQQKPGNDQAPINGRSDAETGLFTPWTIIQYSRQMNQVTCNTTDKLQQYFLGSLGIPRNHKIDKNESKGIMDISAWEREERSKIGYVFCLKILAFVVDG